MPPSSASTTPWCESACNATRRPQPLERRRLHRTTERARRPEPDIIEQHDQHIRRPGRRPQRHDRGEGRVRILGVVGERAAIATILDRKHRSRKLSVAHHTSSAHAPRQRTQQPKRSARSTPPLRLRTWSRVHRRPSRSTTPLRHECRRRGALPRTPGSNPPLSGIAAARACNDRPTTIDRRGSRPPPNGWNAIDLAVPDIGEVQGAERTYREQQNPEPDERAEVRELQQPNSRDGSTTAHTDGSALGDETRPELNGGTERTVVCQASAAATRQNAQGARRRIVANRCHPRCLACTEGPPR